MNDMLTKIGLILNQAENASTEEEAAAFFAKAQQMGTKYSIELATARSHIAKAQQREQPEMRTIDIGNSGQHNLAVFCELFMTIGRPNGLQFNIAKNSTYVIAFGMPSDIDLTEALYASIVQQMMEYSREFIKGGSWKQETQERYDSRTGYYVRKPVDSRVAKRNFYEAFSDRIGFRIREAQRTAEAAVIAEDREEHGVDADGKTGTELVLVGKSVEISDFYKQKSRARGSWKGSQSTYRSSAGQNAGYNAANRASLGGGRSLSGGRKAIG